MKTKLFFLLFSTACFSSYSQTSIEDNRKSHLENLLDTSKHLLTTKDLQSFKSTDYYPINLKYKVTAQFKKSLGKKFPMPTSSNRTPIYRRYGYLYFKLNGENLRLTVYQNQDLIHKEGMKDYLFIPLQDETSGTETYGGGRYLDFTIPETKEVTLDFNLLYNPYCAYSPKYSCPIPPEENTLNTEIKAGEKTPIYHDSKKH